MKTTAAAPLNPELDGRFNGCAISFQYVNPYYHYLTARTCVNMLGFNANRIPTTSIEYQIGCDCIFPFAMNYKGQCIPEEQCNEREAFGDTINRNEKNKNAELFATSKTSSQPQQQQQQPTQSQPMPQFQQQQQQKKQPIDPKNQQRNDFRTIPTNSERSKYIKI